MIDEPGIKPNAANTPAMSVGSISVVVAVTGYRSNIAK
jgi:hypothetical protein